jgi:hypothetical protein
MIYYYEFLLAMRNIIYVLFSLLEVCTTQNIL